MSIRDNENREMVQQAADPGSSSGNPRTVLMFAYYFPPCVCWPTSAARAANFARYLPEFGWRTIVVTRDLTTAPCKCETPSRGPSLHAVDDSEQVDPIAVPVSLESSHLLKRRDQLARSKLTGPIRPLVTLLRKSLTAMIVTTGRSDTWIPTGIRAGERVLERSTIDAVWTTSGPLESISIGQHFARGYRLPWVADLRDSVSHLAGSMPDSLAEYLRRRSFAFRLRNATRVVEVTPQERERDRRWLSNNVDVIPSGFDPADWDIIHKASAARRPEPRRGTSIAYTGRVYRSQDPTPFFLGVRHFTKSRNEATNLRIDYYGSSGSEFTAAAAACGVADFVRDHGVVSIHRARTAMAQADVLLLLSHRGVSGTPGGKFYEYLASGTPILVVPAGDEYIDGTLATTGTGLAASTPEEVRHALEKLLFSPLDPAPDFAARTRMFGWPSRAESLATLLNEAVQTATSEPSHR